MDDAFINEQALTEPAAQEPAVVAPATKERRSTVLAAESTSSDLLRRERAEEVAEENEATERLVQRLTYAQDR